MKKCFLVLGVAIFLFTGCSNNGSTKSDANSADTTSTSTKGAAAITFKDGTYDFGKIKDGEKVSHDFVFENTGEAPLIILNATATCGCTVPEWPKEPIAVGGTAKITVVFDSAGKVGLQDKVVTILANTVPNTTQIHLIGEVTQ